MAVNHISQLLAVVAALKGYKTVNDQELVNYFHDFLNEPRLTALKIGSRSLVNCVFSLVKFHDDFLRYLVWTEALTDV